jgi:hypothetical protein
MRLLKHPALFALVILLVIGILAPVAYAIVDRLVLSVDVDQSEADIEDDLQSQLESAGIPATVTAKKSNNGSQVSISIEPDDKEQAKQLGSDVEVHVPNLPANAVALQMRLEVACELTDAQDKQLEDTMNKADFLTVLSDRPAGQTDAQLADAIKKSLADHGWRDADVSVTKTSVSVTIKAPPR